MNIFISGGAKNGKSTLAQNLAVQLAEGAKEPGLTCQSEAPSRGNMASSVETPRLYYIATMVPTDEEDDERIRRHQEDREGLGFITIEKGSNIAEIIKDEGPTSVPGKEAGRSIEGKEAFSRPNSALSLNPEGTFLLDSVTALLSNVMFPPSGEFNERAGEEVTEDLLAFIEKVKTRGNGNIIFVSDYIYSEAKVFDEWTERYRKALAYIDRCLAEKCEGVAEVSAGRATWHKGVEPGPGTETEPV